LPPRSPRRASKQGSTEAGTYKYALGWDSKAGANMWLELRCGRAVARTVDKEETRAP
jgi:hypothetical protein